MHWAVTLFCSQHSVKSWDGVVEAVDSGDRDESTYGGSGGGLSYSNVGSVPLIGCLFATGR